MSLLKVDSRAKVYLLRCPDHMAEALLKNPAIKQRPKSYPVETRRFGKGASRLSTGMVSVRVVMDAPPPEDTPLATWRLIGHTSLPGSPTYNPPDRCKRGHAPLRYLSNGGCVECMSARMDPIDTVRVTLQFKPEEVFEEIVEAMGWKVAQRRFKDGRWLVTVDAGVARRLEIYAVMRAALGWDPLV